MFYRKLIHKLPTRYFASMIALICLGFWFSFYSLSTPASADEVQELQRQIDELEHLKSLSEDATEPLVAEVQSLEQRIQNARASMARAHQQAELVAAEIKEREADLQVQYSILAKRVTEQYKRSRIFNPLMLIFTSSDATKLAQDLAYRNSVKAQDNRLIKAISDDIVELERDRQKLEQDQRTLVALERQLDEQVDFFRGEIEKAREYQQTLAGQIEELSARQQAIIDARSGSFTFTLGSGELADEYLSSARGFQESAPSGYFAVFSFGGYSHRKGMSQYGARGRAEAGQSYREILNTYYGKEPVDRDTGGTIRVANHGELDFEGHYLLGIAEMPSNWHHDALKAQAVAARTYAYRFKQDGREICITQSCQVYSASKANIVRDDPDHPWRRAVEETRGEILEDVVTFYSSTSGGFLTTLGWDTTDGSGGSGFLDKAYEKLGRSPWLQKAWWRQGYTNSGSTCGRANPWLSPEEMADIVNAAIALRTPGIDTSRISPVTTDCWGGEPYSMSELRDLVKNHGGLSAATNVTVAQGNGVTQSVVIDGVSMTGSEFRRAFNLRAPGHLRIPQYPNTYGQPFFLVEKK